MMGLAYEKNRYFAASVAIFIAAVSQGWNETIYAWSMAAYFICIIYDFIMYLYLRRNDIKILMRR